MKEQRKNKKLYQLSKELKCKNIVKNGINFLVCNEDAPKTVFLLHGVTGGKFDMMPLAKAYSEKGYTVYAIDLPGHGKSKWLEKLDSFEDLANWLDLVIASTKKPDIIVSNSLASSIIYYYLANRDLKDTKIILGCPTPETSHLSNFMQKLMNHTPEAISWTIYNTKPIQVIRGIAGMNTFDKKVWEWFSESEDNKKDEVLFDATSKLTNLLYEQNPFKKYKIPKEIQKRITVVMGTSDPVVKPKARKIMQKLLPYAKFRFVPKAGHILHFEAVDSLLPDDKTN